MPFQINEIYKKALNFFYNYFVFFFTKKIQLNKNNLCVLNLLINIKLIYSYKLFFLSNLLKKKLKMMDIQNDAFADDEDVFQEEPKSSKDLTLELDEKFDKDCLTKRIR